MACVFVLLEFLQVLEEMAKGVWFVAAHSGLVLTEKGEEIWSSQA